MTNPFQKRFFHENGIEEHSYMDFSGTLPRRFNFLRLTCFESTVLQPGRSLLFNEESGNWALHYITEGKCEIRNDEEAIFLEEGDVFLFRREKTFLLQASDQEVFRKKTLQILKTPSLEVLCGPPDTLEKDVMRPENPRNFERFFIEIEKLLACGSPEIRKKLSTLIYSCLAELDSVTYHHAELESTLSDALLRDPTAFGHIDALAKFCGMSRRTLFRFFRKNFQCTPIEYVIRRKLEKSRWYLNCYLDMPVAEVARLAGYNSASFFTREFKRLYKMTPGEYRRAPFDGRRYEK